MYLSTNTNLLIFLPKKQFCNLPAVKWQTSESFIFIQQSQQLFFAKPVFNLQRACQGDR